MSQQAGPTAEPTPPPSPGGPAVRWWWLFVAPLLAVAVVAAGAAALVVSNGGRDTSDAHAMSGAAAPLELASVSEDIAGHYRYAEAHQADLSVIPCFCGCEEFLAHENLYDCFLRTDGAGYDSHAAGCGVCIGEAVVASQLLDAGTSAIDVADRIVEQFGTTPITSPDQTIPRT
jgi:hypothetical protein